MALADDLVLLLTRDDGKPMVEGWRLDLLAAGAVLADLVLAGAVRVSEKGESVRKDRLVVDLEVAPPIDPLLFRCRERLAEQPSHRLEKAVERISKGLVDEVYQRLVRAEAVSVETSRVLLVSVTRRVVIGDAKRDLLTRLDEVLLAGQVPDDRTAALIALLHTAGSLHAVVDRGRGIDKRDLRRQGEQLVATTWAARAAAKAIQAVEATVAVIAAS